MEWQAAVPIPLTCSLTSPSPAPQRGDSNVPPQQEDSGWEMRNSCRREGMKRRPGRPDFKLTGNAGEISQPLFLPCSVIISQQPQTPARPSAAGRGGLVKRCLGLASKSPATFVPLSLCFQDPSKQRGAPSCRGLRGTGIHARAGLEDLDIALCSVAFVAGWSCRESRGGGDGRAQHGGGIRGASSVRCVAHRKSLL